jgi:serine/threonine protein kinase
MRLTKASNLIEKDKKYLDGDKIDMWSLGIIIYQLFMGHVPYHFGDTKEYCTPFQMVFENTE